MSECLYGQQQALWKPVDNSCGKPDDLARPRSTPLQEINLLYLGELVDSLVHANDFLAARLDSLELQLAELFGMLRVRQIREEMTGPELQLAELFGMLRVRQIREEMTGPDPIARPGPEVAQ